MGIPLVQPSDPTIEHGKLGPILSISAPNTRGTQLWNVLDQVEVQENLGASPL